MLERFSANQLLYVPFVVWTLFDTFSIMGHNSSPGQSGEYTLKKEGAYLKKQWNAHEGSFVVVVVVSCCSGSKVKQSCRCV